MLDPIFSIANLIAMFGWALLIFVPTWRGAAQVFATYIIPTLLAVAYMALIGVWMSRSAGGFGSLDDVHSLFQTRGALLAGWIHYLAFDLFLGAWIAREARREGLPHAAVVPLLLLTFLFGPIGYLSSLAVRAAWRAGFVSEEILGNSSIAQRLGLRQPDSKLLGNALLFVLSVVPSIVAALIDDRIVDGANVWFKPIKFEVSLTIYLATLALFLPMAGENFRRGFGGRFVVWVTIATSALELIYIVVRASRGEASHFNVTSTSANILYALMGVGALLLSTSGGLLAWGVARNGEKPVNPPFRLAVVLGLSISFVLGTLGGIAISVNNGRFVGKAAPDAQVIPFTGWSRSVGDLRVAHFFGLHAQQLLPIFGALSALRFGRAAKPSIAIFGVVYALLIVGLFAQAVSGHAFAEFGIEIVEFSLAQEQRVEDLADFG